MKKVNWIFNIVVLTLGIAFTSCEDEIERETTHSIVAAEVVGTYNGTITLDSTAMFEDAVLTLLKYEVDSIAVDALVFTISSAAFNYNADGLYLPRFYDADTKEIYEHPVYLNVAKANDIFNLSCSNPEALRLAGKLKSDSLFMTIPIMQTKNQTLFHVNGVNWEFKGARN